MRYTEFARPSHVDLPMTSRPSLKMPGAGSPSAAARRSHSHLALHKLLRPRRRRRSGSVNHTGELYESSYGAAGTNMVVVADDGRYRPSRVRMPTLWWR